MLTSNQHEPCFRIYLGKSNWVNLSPQITADLKAIYEEGKPTRYKLAPGLFIDILPRDVDCNSKTTELPRLMRADLCYDDDDGIISSQIRSSSNNNQDNTATTSTSSPTLAERQEAVQQNLSRFIKAELEKQGIVDVFPPSDAGQELLPLVSTLAPHRHLGLIPTPHKNTKRSLQRQKHPLATEKQPISSTSLPSSLAFPSPQVLGTSYAPNSGKPPSERKQTRKKTRKDDKNFTPSTISSSSSDSASSSNTQLNIAEKKFQPPVPYHLRSSTSLSTAKKVKMGKTSTPPSTNSISSSLGDDTYFPQAPLVPCQPKLAFDYEGEDDDNKTAGGNANTNSSERTDFFPGIDFVSPTAQLSPLWHTNFLQQQHLQRSHPITLSSPSLPVFHHHHHHHHQFQLQARDHQYHTRLQNFPDDGGNDDNPPAGWDLHEWTNRHHCHQQQQNQQQQDFGMYSSSVYSVSSASSPPPFHRYDVDSATTIDIDPTDLQQQPTYTNDTVDRGENTSSLPVPSPPGMHNQLQHSPYSSQHNSHCHHHPLTGRCYPENQYTNPPHLPFLFMPPAAASPVPTATHVEDTSNDTTALLSTSSSSPS